MTCEYSFKCGNNSGCGSCNYISGNFDSGGYSSSNYLSQDSQINYEPSHLRGNYKE